MKVTSTILRQIAAMPMEAMAATLLFVAEQLDQEERKRAGAAERKSRQRARDKGATVTPESQQSHAEVTALAPVLYNITSTSKQEESKEKDNLTVIQKAPSSKPLPSDPKGFSEFFEIYPKRSGGNDRAGAAKGFIAALKRAGGIETILDGARRYRAFCDANDKTDTEYVLKARKWLNNQMWNETYETHQRRPGTNSIAAGFSRINAAFAAEEAAIREEEERAGIGGEDAHDISGLRKIA